MSQPTRWYGSTASLLLALAGVTGSITAQQTLDSRWLPWLGCWQVQEAAMDPEDLLVCVRPAPGDVGVEIATISRNQVTSVRSLVADGQLHDLEVDDCQGWQSGTFSADGRRAYVHSEQTCAGDVRRSASVIMAMSTPFEWLDAQAIGLDGERMPRVVRYRPAPESSWPEGFAVPSERRRAVRDARFMAAAPMSVADVEEAARSVDPEALVAFVIERGQTFDLDAGTVVALAEAGVPDDVIDVVVAVSYPDRFVIDRDAMQAAIQPQREREDREGYERRRGYGGPFGWGWWGRGSCYRGLYWSPYCSGFGYGPYGYGFGWYDPYWYGYAQPIIIVRDGQSGSRQGRAVRGRGYTRGGSGVSGGTAQPRDRNGPSSSVSGSGGGSGGGKASGGGYTRSGGSSSGRTAKPRGK